VRAPNIRIIFAKELLDVLRDRRTILSMIVFPIIAVPLLMIGITKMFSEQMQKTRDKSSRIVVIGGDHAPEIVKRMQLPAWKIAMTTAPDPKQAVLNTEVDAAIEFPMDWQKNIEEGKDGGEVIIHRQGSEVASMVAEGKLKILLEVYKEEQVKRRLRDLKADPTLIKPFAVVPKDVPGAIDQGAAIAATIIPYLLIFLCLVGATYIAIDLTAGERERGTLETLLVSPAGRVEIIVGKLLTVFTVSMTSVVLSLISMVVTQALFGSDGAKTEGGLPTITLSVPLKAMGLMLVLVLPLSIMFSSLTIAMSLFAKSYKEAMTYLSPLMLFAILPTMLPMLPGFKPSLPFAMIPVANASVAMSQILKDQYSWGFIGITLATLFGLAVLSLMLAVNLFNKERVLFRS
jgi:sodium transport system permease protein